jgi:hypothetical protein
MPCRRPRQPKTDTSNNAEDSPAFSFALEWKGGFAMAVFRIEKTKDYTVMSTSGV